MIDEGYPKELGFNMADPRVQRLYPHIVAMCSEHFSGARATESVLSYREYVHKIFGPVTGSAIFGEALRDARQLSELPIIEPGQ